MIQHSDPMVVYLDQMIHQQSRRRDDLLNRKEADEAALVDEDIARLKTEKAQVLRDLGFELPSDAFGEVVLPSEGETEH